MKVVQINATCGRGSTGKIAVAISELLTQAGVENYILYCSGTSDYPLAIKCADDRYIRLQALKSRVLGNWGFNSRRATEKMISELERIQPDIVHLHNIHGHDCNLEMLFSYFREKQIKLVWTFHDCWAFTGYCMHFDMSGCDKWKAECGECPQKRKYTWLFDNSGSLFQRKKKLFTGLDLTIVTPSQWLADMVEQSFLRDYDVKVIYNGIDLSVFHPAESDFRKRYGLERKYLVLGVAFDWGIRKGLDVFAELSRRLGEEYQIVLVGTNDHVDKQLPSDIISIHRTENQHRLAEIYSAADVFVNPTREEVLGLVNIEANACGTPVITFRSGGSPECIDMSSGSVVGHSVDALEGEIIRVCRTNPYSREACIERARLFSDEDKFREYVALYQELCKEDVI